MKREFPGYIGNTIYASLQNLFGVKRVLFPIILLGDKRFKRLYAYYKGKVDGRRAAISVYETAQFK